MPQTSEFLTIRTMMQNLEPAIMQGHGRESIPPLIESLSRSIERIKMRSNIKKGARNYLITPFKTGSALTNLTSVPEKVIRENASHHCFSNRHGPDTDARVVPALCHDIHLFALTGNGFPLCQNR